MSTLAYAMGDSVTMLRRDLRHSLRYPAMTIAGMAVPVLFLLVFVGLFGNTLSAGLGHAAAPGHYIDYIVPGIIVMIAGSCAEGTAVGVCTDMTAGVIARFRAMAIARTSVLTGQVLGSLIRTLISGALVLALAIGLGFRPTASPLECVAAVGVFAMVSLALTWVGVAFGVYAKTPEGANSLSLILQVLPFVSSAFVPTATMPGAARWFAQSQPFTPVIETLRSLLTGTPMGSSAILAAAWCAGLAVAGYLAARVLYNRNRTPPPVST